MVKQVAYRARYNRHGTLNLEKRYEVFGREFWLPFAWNVSLYTAQRIMEKRSMKPMYFLADGTAVPDIW